MDPVTALLVAAAATKAVGALQSGYSKADEYKSQAGVAGYNRDVANQNAETTSVQSGLREEQVRREARQTQGAQRAGVAESGTGFGGSNREIMDQDAVTASLDALNTRYDGQLQRRGYEAEAVTSELQRKAAKRSASSAIKAGWLAAGSAVLQGASGYASGGSSMAGSGGSSGGSSGGGSGSMGPKA